MTEILIDNFSKSVAEFVDAASEVWPDNAQIKEFKEKFSPAVAAELFVEVQFKPYYARKTLRFWTLRFSRSLM